MLKLVISLFLACFLTGCQVNTEYNMIDCGSSITLNGEVIKSLQNGVYLANDIVYYKDNTDFIYGEGKKKDKHSEKEAKEHTVIHITKPGTYEFSGKLKGQIAVDLGENSRGNKSSVVNIVLNNMNIDCSVAPAIIIYNAYEPFNKFSDKLEVDINTEKAGVNLIIADDSINNISGSYVARIYRPSAVLLNKEKTKVIDSRKLHKYDGAIHSIVSMNISGEEKGNGLLNIVAENEGISSEMHLTINGGIIDVVSENDGINANEDYLSVLTINGGKLYVRVDGVGDGIDSNGYIVLNGGEVVSQSSVLTVDAGLDGEEGIFYRNGELKLSGNLPDNFKECKGTSIFFNFEKPLGAGNYLLKDMDGNIVIEYNIINNFKSIVFASGEIPEGKYTLWKEDKQLVGTGLNPNLENIDNSIFDIKKGDNIFYYVAFKN